MTRNHTGWLVFIAALGMMAGLLGHEVSALNSWDTAMSPGFVGKALVHFGTVIGAFIAGKLLPQI